MAEVLISAQELDKRLAAGAAQDGAAPLVLDVRNDGVASTSTAQAPGNGLRGLTERVEAAGGLLRAGAEPGGGFRLTATLPVDDPALAQDAGRPVPDPFAAHGGVR